MICESQRANINHCAETVKSADPDRFLAAMAAPADCRAALFVLFAFNVEVSRAPWVTQEPLIAQMRLQWWRDAVEEIYSGGTPRRHEVTTPLADLVAQHKLPRNLLDAIIDARGWDIDREPFADDAALAQYLRDTSGGLMGLSFQALDGQAVDAAVDFGQAVGVANWLRAVPALVAANRIPLLDGTHAGLVRLAQNALQQLSRAQAALAAEQRPAKAALRSGWLAKSALQQVVKRPQDVGDGLLEPSDFRKRLRLLRLGWTNGI